MGAQSSFKLEPRVVRCLCQSTAYFSQCIGHWRWLGPRSSVPRFSSRSFLFHRDTYWFFGEPESGSGPLASLMGQGHAVQFLASQFGGAPVLCLLRSRSLRFYSVLLKGWNHWSRSETATVCWKVASSGAWYKFDRALLKGDQITEVLNAPLSC